ncbi:hypothetical protein ACFY9C_10725 [Streptomyces filamentosus]
MAEPEPDTTPYGAPSAALVERAESGFAKFLERVGDDAPAFEGDDS